MAGGFDSFGDSLRSSASYAMTRPFETSTIGW